MLKYKKVKYEEIFSPPMMSLFVISACNLQCEECIMLNQMKTHAAYQMSLEELTKFVEVSEKSGYSFHYRYTGGEPLYWKNLKEGTRILRRSKTCKSILLMTNGMKHENLTDEVIAMIDYVRISQYEYNHDQIAILKEKHPDKVKIVDREDFTKNPRSVIENALPVECGNDEHLLFNNRVYSCPHSYSLSLRHGMSEFKLGEEVRENYLENMAQIRHGHEKICCVCIGNKKVRDQMENIKNTSPLIQIKRNK